MAPPRRATRRRRAVALGWGTVVLAVVLVTAGTIRGCTSAGVAGPRADASGRLPGAPVVVSAEPPTVALGEPSAPALSAGWEEAAETIVAELRGLLDGRARAGAFAEAQAEAAREDLGRYPPERGQLRRMLLGTEGERARALAALSVRPVLDDDLAGLVLRSHRPEDDPLIRLLAAEVVAAMPPDVLSRHEEELLRAFAAEENPLVLAVALPSLEQLAEPRLEQLLRAQLELASAPMLPVLVGLARDRLGADALAQVGVLVIAPGTALAAGD